MPNSNNKNKTSGKHEPSISSINCNCILSSRPEAIEVRLAIDPSPRPACQRRRPCYAPSPLSCLFACFHSEFASRPLFPKPVASQPLLTLPSHPNSLSPRPRSRAIQTAAMEQVLIVTSKATHPSSTTSPKPVLASSGSSRASLTLFPMFLAY